MNERTHTMQNPNDSVNASNGSESTNTPVTPVDVVIAKFKKWVENVEQQMDEAKKQADTPRDIPRFVTRYR